MTTLADDGLRVRSEPRVSDDSYMYEPLLPVGTDLYVLDGPVSASGYDWYDVVTLTSRTLPRGWVASAGRDGEPWIAAGAFDCPPVPSDFASLSALSPGVGLVCFSRLPITVRARLFDDNADPGPFGGWLVTGWEGTGLLLVDTGETRPPADPREWFGLALDPPGEHPDVLPVGEYLGDTAWSQPEVVEVTGLFDHPSAESCTSAGEEPPPAPIQQCRLAFVVTRVRVLGP